ncbi:MAG: hypothetical protein JJ894_02650 [Dinoroseobacter sp.]|nr:hypothetical protein [Dinoroseobacter sp.]
MNQTRLDDTLANQNGQLPVAESQPKTAPQNEAELKQLRRALRCVEMITHLVWLLRLTGQISQAQPAMRPGDTLCQGFLP